MTAMLQIAPVAAETLATRARTPWPVLEGGKSEIADPIAAILQGIGAVVKFKRNAAVVIECDSARHVY